MSSAVPGQARAPRRRLDPKYAPVLVPAIMAIAMSLVMSLVQTIARLGFAPKLLFRDALPRVVRWYADNAHRAPDARSLFA